jgi:tol-pal system protein YbgF
MLGLAYSPNTMSAMLRPVFLAAAFSLALSICPASAQDSDSDVVTRLDRLEGAIRDLTGNIEQLQYRNQQLEQQVQRLQAQIPGGAPAASAPPPPAQRPIAPYQQQAAPYPQPQSAPYQQPAPIMAPEPAGSAPVDQAPGGRRGDAFNPALSPGAPGAPRPLGTSTTATEPPPPVSDDHGGGPRQPGAPLDLSTMSSNAAAVPQGVPPPPPVNPNATGAMQASLPPPETPKDQYDLAYSYLQHKDYPHAAEGFRTFLKQYPSDRMTPEAQYWLGESLFQSQQYRDAAEAFLTLSTKYDTTAKAPDALLKLGMSLAALNEKEAACASLGEVLRKYPRASLNVKQSVDREQKRVGC